MSGVAAPAAIWHDLECGGYAADLVLWEELADAAESAVLDLGCGSGRVALHLARRGHRVLALDSDAGLLAVLARRGRGLPLETEEGDARDFDLGARFGLVLAPMQLLQLLDGPRERRRCLERIAAHLEPGGTAALAIVDAMPVPERGAAPLPDAREVDGWVYSSLPLASEVDGGSIVVRRLRQTVSPAGDLTEEVEETVLRELDAATLEAEAAAAGLAPAGRREVPPSDAHVGSTVVLARREA